MRQVPRLRSCGSLVGSTAATRCRSLRWWHLTIPQGKRIKVYEGAGCPDCRGTRYLGRSGIFETVPVDDAIKPLIIEQADSQRIKREAVKNGMRTLRQSALKKLAEGVTTFEEVVRVTTL